MGDDAERGPADTASMTTTYTGPTCLQAVEAAAVAAMLRGDLPLHYRLQKIAARLEQEASK